MWLAFGMQLTFRSITVGWMLLILSTDPEYLPHLHVL